MSTAERTPTHEELTDSYDYNDPDDDLDKPTPLPKLQLFVVFLIQDCDYPFVNQFVRETGITKGDERKTGYYAGLIASVFFFAESVTVVQWGYLSDRYGRRPILLFGPLGLSIVMLVFGLTTSFWPLVFWRFLQGLFNGNIGVSKSVIAEMTDSTNIGDAYALIPFMWSLGTTTGPVIGGVLTDPASRWPDVFGRSQFFRHYPYFLPCAVASFVAFVSFVVAFLALKETLPSLVLQEQLEKSKKYPSDNLIQVVEPSSEVEARLIDHGEAFNYGTTPIQRSNSQLSTTSSSTVTCSSGDIRPAEPANLRTLLFGPLFLPLSNYTLLAFLDMSHGVLLPLMYSSSIPLGGLGLDPFQIGSALGIFGFVNSLVQAKLLGPCIRKFGSRDMYIFTFSSIIVCFIMYPILNALARRAGGIDVWVGIGIAIQLTFQMMGFAAYGAMQVLIVQTVPEGGPMATVNGVAQMLASGMRSIAPTFASSLFSISLTRQLAGGNLVYYVLMAINLAGIHLALLLAKPPKKHKKSTRSRHTN